MYDMWTQKDPALVGPTTSIPGLFYGPWWYYFALPLNVLLQFHPVAGVITVQVLVVASIYLCWRWLSPLTAFMYAISVGIIGTQQTAWTPYMTIFFTLPILIVLMKTVVKKRMEYRQMAVLALCAGLLFHVQVAFAVVMLPLVVSFLLVKRYHLSWRKWLLAGGIVGMCLLPSFVFELKHDFLQTRAVMQFVKEYREQSQEVQPNQPGLRRIPEIAGYTLQPLNQILSWDVQWVGGIALLAYLLWSWNSLSQISRTQLQPIAWMIGGTFLLYLFLPAKSYYFVALYPAWLILLSQQLQKLKNFQLRYAVVALSLLAVVQAFTGYTRYRQLAQTENFLLAPNLTAVDRIYALADGRPFASYHFLPEVYDYVYQVIYIHKHLKGAVLPTEFSYAPGEYTYIPQKKLPVSNTKPEVVFFLTQKYYSEPVFDEWWGRVTANAEITQSVSITPATTLYVATQK